MQGYRTDAIKTPARSDFHTVVTEAGVNVTFATLRFIKTCSRIDPTRSPLTAKPPGQKSTPFLGATMARPNSSEFRGDKLRVTPNHFVFGHYALEMESENAWRFEVSCGVDSHAHAAF